MSKDTPPQAHGTYSAAQWHRRNGVPTCEPCRAAHAAYMRKYREGNPAVRERNRRQHVAYSRAETRLREAHRDEFERYYAEERTMVEAQAV